MFAEEDPYDDDKIRCPNCSSNKVAINVNSQGYYEVVSCSKCGYKKINI